MSSRSVIVRFVGTSNGKKKENDKKNKYPKTFVVY